MYLKRKFCRKQRIHPQAFAHADLLRTEHPPLAMVESVEITAWNEAESLKDFRIIESAKLPQRRTLISPDIAACPDCLRENLPLVAVQHHHAHMVSCMADNRLSGKCLGIIWDGTVLGNDGTIWDGEFLVGDERGFERLGSIRPIPLIGGDKAIQDIARIGYGMAKDAGVAQESNPVWDRMLERGINCPTSTGMGRLFDGVCALLGLRREVSYEGQGAVLLEAAAVRDEGRYPVVIDGLVFDWREMVRAIMREYAAGVPVGIIAARFMNTLVDTAAEISCRIATEKDVQKVVLSGGVFQNQYLLARLPERLRNAHLGHRCYIGPCHGARYFAPCDAVWCGMGKIPQEGAEALKHT